MDAGAQLKEAALYDRWREFMESESYTADDHAKLTTLINDPKLLMDALVVKKIDAVLGAKLRQDGDIQTRHPLTDEDCKTILHTSPIKSSDFYADITDQVKSQIELYLMVLTNSQDSLAFPELAQLRMKAHLSEKPSYMGESSDAHYALEKMVGEILAL